jgi:membrane protein implicated in regulation of membrane protease activity
MDANYWWIWMILAAVFIAGEIFTAGFFLLWFGVGAVVSGLLALAGAGTIVQLAAFIVVSLVLFGVSRPLANRMTKKQPPGIGADRFVGKECVVLEAIDNETNSGRVRLDQEEWRALNATGGTIPVGSMAVVKEVSGTHLVVKTKEGK